MADSGPDVVVRRVEPQLVAGLSVTDHAEDVGALFYELESTVRDAGARASLPPGMLTDLRGGATGFEVFVPVTRPVGSGRVASHRLPASRVASLIHRGPYDGMPGARRSLEEWIAAAGLERSDPTRILYLQFGAEPELELPQAYLADQDKDFVTEIQVPVAGG
jgi:effector-binding domain-containing protein